MKTLTEFNQTINNLTNNITYPYNTDFVHLHVHSELSLLDGACKISDLANKCVETNSPLVITDHGNVAASLIALKTCAYLDKPIDFIRGIETYVKNDNISDDSFALTNAKYHHLILLPYTKEGFENINKLSSLGYLEGAETIASQTKAVVTKQHLKEHSKGIVATSGCLYGEVSNLIWGDFPYMKLLSMIDDKLGSELIESSRTLISEKGLLTKKQINKTSITNEDLLKVVIKNKTFAKQKPLQHLNESLFKTLATATNEQIIEAFLSDEQLVNTTINLIKDYIDIFDFFFLEVQDHGMFEQRLTTIICKYICENYNLPTQIVITNDVHYINKQDSMYQDALLCISLKKQIFDEDRFKFDGQELYFKSIKELQQTFSYLTDIDRATYLKNSTKIAHICLNYKPTLNEKFYPEFEIPNEFENSEEYLLHLILKGASRLCSTHKSQGDSFRYSILKYIPLPILKHEIYSNIDLKKAIEYTKDTTTQSKVNTIIELGLSKSIENLLNYVISTNNLDPKLLPTYKEVLHRVIYEFSIFVVKGIADYFLIVEKIISLSKENNIPVGPGRGSVAGSVNAYLLGITEIDSLEYNLYFERFINPERNSYPDIDTDFSKERLEEVKELTREYFGRENCCGVNALGNLKNKSAIQDSLRVYGFKPQLGISISKKISNDFPIMDSILKQSDLSEQYNSDTTFKNAIDTAVGISGFVRNSGTNAAGTIIAPKHIDLSKKLPLMVIGNRINSQYDKKDVEDAGFLKMDLLGLRTLDIIEKTVQLIQQTRRETINIETIPLNDSKTYELFQKGDTDFVFQVNSNGMKDFLVKLKPTCIEDICVVVAGYRPGPMQYLFSFIEVKAGRKHITFRDKRLEAILSSTGGFAFYQEQVMDIFKTLAGYSHGRADIVRRVMGKKDAKTLEKEKNNFIYGIPKKDSNGNVILNTDGTKQMEVLGCINNGVSEQDAIEIFSELTEFANYGFNKGHSMAYSFLAYRTAYLKANYFLEYITSVLISVQENKTELTKHINIVRAKGVTIALPNINKSLKDMSLSNETDNCILTGFLAIKNLSHDAINNVLSERELGDFISLDDFLNRMIGKYSLDKKSLEALVKSGCFDEFNKNIELLLNRLSEFRTVFLLNKKSLSKVHPNQITILNSPLFKDFNLFNKKVLEDTALNFEERIKYLCESNNSGFPDEIFQHYSNLKSTITKNSRPKPNQNTVFGTVYAIIEEEFALTKKRTSFMGKALTIEGLPITIFATINKIGANKSIKDISQFKVGNVVSIQGAFSLEEREVEDYASDSFSTILNVTCFPNLITIETITNSSLENTLQIDLDTRLFDIGYTKSYYQNNNIKCIFDSAISKCIGDYKKDNIVLFHKTHSKSLDISTSISNATLNRLGFKHNLTSEH